MEVIAADRLNCPFAHCLTSLLLRAVGKAELEAHPAVLVPSIKQREHLPLLLLKGTF